MVFFLIYICIFSEFSTRCGFTFRCYLNFKELGAVVDVVCVMIGSVRGSKMVFGWSCR